MSLREDIPLLIKAWDDHKSTLSHNAEIFDIFEGNLLEHVLADLKADMSAETYKEIATRAAPINVLKRLVEKLSKIYAKPPVRLINDGTEGDNELLSKYVEEMDLNTEMGSSQGANGFFNLFKNAWVEPYLDEDDGCPKVRVIPSDRFFVCSSDRANPTKPTHLVKIMGTIKGAGGAEATLFYAYTADEFLIFDSDKTIHQELMAISQNPDGINPVGALPGIYLNRSKHMLMPKPDSDTLKMTKLIPILLSDLNFALKYSTFGAIVGIDVEFPKTTWGPSTVISLKSDKNSEKSGTVTTIKPEVDSDKALAQIRALFSLWMQTRNIKPGAMGDITVENAASGIAKAIDEMDTSEDRQNQVPYFKKGEELLWQLIMTKYHELWSENANFKFRGLKFSPKAKVVVTFAEQRPNVDPSVAVDTQVKKLDAGLQTKKGALQELYPDWTDKQIEQKLAEIEEETATNLEKQQAMMAEQGIDPNAPKDGSGGNPTFGKKPEATPPKKDEAKQ
jgi:hypothetical protein